MKISIITPSLNQGRFIADAVKSVSNQNYSCFEHIVIDAQSDDETIDVLKKFATLSHLTWVSESDTGQSDAINKGFRQASGDIIAWLNADDYYSPQTFSKIATIFESNPDIDILYGDTMYVDKNNKILRCKRDHPFDYNVLLYYGCYIESTSTFFRRRIIDSDNFLDTSYKSAMDYEYFVRLANKGFRFEYVPEVFGVFRWHGSNVSLDRARAKPEIDGVLDRYGFRLTTYPKLQREAYAIASNIYRIKRRLLRSKFLLKTKYHELLATKM